jgi:hypothetical protein
MRNAALVVTLLLFAIACGSESAALPDPSPVPRTNAIPPASAWPEVQVAGRVINVDTGGPAANATVTLLNLTIIPGAPAITDGNGTFAMTARVPPGYADWAFINVAGDTYNVTWHEVPRWDQVLVAGVATVELRAYPRRTISRGETIQLYVDDLYGCTVFVYVCRGITVTEDNLLLEVVAPAGAPSVGFLLGGPQNTPPFNTSDFFPRPSTVTASSGEAWVLVNRGIDSFAGTAMEPFIVSVTAR